MNVELFEHIAVYKNVYPEGYCQHLISEFERLEEEGVGANRQRSENAPAHIKDDFQIDIQLRSHRLMDFNEQRTGTMFFDGLQGCYDDYTSKYAVLYDAGRIRASTMKMQRTSPGGGYHVWHCEQGPEANANRVVVYMLYLNDIAPQDGAETEFLYQRKRFSPTENTMLLWPAAYTHAHRGNPVLGSTHKYIVTGWFYYD
jgi:hypothetical protein